MGFPKINREVLADWATVVMAVSAIIVAGVVVYQNFFGTSDPREDWEVDDWEAYVAGGRRIGPDDADVVIVEFGDYECPFCRRLEPSLQAVLDEYPNDVALIHRHMPLPYHASAYPAARLAECAAEQGKFREAHTYLYSVEALDEIDVEAFTEVIGVSDPSSFLSCARDQRPVPRIEEDLAAAAALEVRSTPTIVVNGLRLGRTPDLGRLFELVQSAIPGGPSASRR